MQYIVIVFVANIPYMSKFYETCRQLRTNGQYEGDIVLIIGNDQKEIELNDFIHEFKVQLKFFPDIIFPPKFMTSLETLHSDRLDKFFQWHKLNVFHPFFKKWEFVFYIDCGMTIHHPVQPIINCAIKNKFLAHSDGYGSGWDLSSQFDHNHHTFSKLSQTYNLAIDFPQTTIMLFDTDIIKQNTINEIIELATEYPCSRTNEQGIIALYFIYIHPLWEQIKLGDTTRMYYDYCPREIGKEYIMFKMIV